MHESQEFVAKKISEHDSLSPEENQKITIEALRRFKNIILKKLEYNHFNYIERTITVKYVMMERIGKWIMIKIKIFLILLL